MGSTDAFIKRHLKYLAKEFKYVEQGLQLSTSKICGQYCLFAVNLFFYDFDIPFDELMNSNFSDDRKENDEKVMEFIRQVEDGGKTV